MDYFEAARLEDEGRVVAVRSDDFRECANVGTVVSPSWYDLRVAGDLFSAEVIAIRPRGLPVHEDRTPPLCSNAPQKSDSGTTPRMAGRVMAMLR